VKQIPFTLICLFMISFSAITWAYVKDDVWQVHRAAEPPIIDGQMDAIYWSASTERVIVPDPEVNEPDGYLDCFGEARIMWDDTNIYVFVKVVDDELSSSSENNYENDGIEVYFDAGNDKDATYGEDDVQTRIELQDEDDVTQYDSCPEGTVGATAEWEALDGDAFGFAIEVAYPLEGLSIAAEAGEEFGFEIQINDRDNEQRDTMLRWWGNDNMAWQDPSLFGTAVLIDYEANEILNIPAAVAPTVDGELDAAWVDVPVIEAGTYVYQNDGVPGGQFVEIEENDDLQMEFRAGWAADAMYFWVEVIDDELDNTGTNDYENDGLEIYFDGGNDKLDAYDEDDVQSRFVWDTEDVVAFENAEWAWGELEDADLLGYTFEAIIPVEDLTFEPEADLEIGFEIQVNDRDNAQREAMSRWWSDDNISWQKPSVFGTAMLIGEVPDDVDNDVQPGEFGLAQNYPNPFNPTTTIQFNLAQKSNVKLTVYDVLGNEIATLVNDLRQAGANTVQFDGSNLSSGVYFYTLETATEVITNKMMLMK